MARITVEDCVAEVSNKFELVILAAQRAKNIASGEVLTITPENDKNPVIALREIAAGNIDFNTLRKLHIVSLQKNNTVETAPEENLYAETQQESIGEEIDYTSNSEEDIFLHDATLDIEIEPDFSDNIIDQDQ